MKKLILCIFILVSCGFMKGSIKTTYTKNIWSFFKDDSEHGIVVTKMVDYDEEGKPLIYLKFVNKSDSIFVQIEFQVQVTYYTDYFYNKTKRVILTKDLENPNQKYVLYLKPYSFAQIHFPLRNKIRIKDVRFYTYKSMIIQ